MAEKILFVDDDANLLASIQRQLRNQFMVDTAIDGNQGVDAIQRQGPYATVVSDFRMPGMNGVEFLSQVREISPNTPRILLTGNADLETAIGAVNEGNIFRLLTKPCPPETLKKALTAGIKQYQLVVAERELLEKTLSGSIKVLTEVLSLLNPEAFGHASRITRYVRQIAQQMHRSECWELETAAMLSQLGWILLPEDVLKKIYRGVKLTEKEDRLYKKHPSISADLITKIPRLERIAEIISNQQKHFDGTGIPENSLCGGAIPFGARVLKVAIDFDSLETAGNLKGKTLEELRQRTGWYDPNILAALETIVGIEAKYEVISVTVRELVENMILAEDVKSAKGVLLISRGHEISLPLIQRLRNIMGTFGVKEPIKVLVPVKV